MKKNKKTALVLALALSMSFIQMREAQAAEDSPSQEGITKEQKNELGGGRGWLNQAI